MQSYEIKTLKVMHSSNTKENESHTKELQNKFREASKIVADKTKELNKLKQDIVPEEPDIMLSRSRQSPSLPNKNNRPSTQNERNREIDSLTSDFEEFKKFVTEKLFSLKTCVETVRNRGIDQNCETTGKQK